MRISLCRALYQQNSLTIIDGTFWLSIPTILRVEDFIRRYGGTLIMTVSKDIASLLVEQSSRFHLSLLLDRHLTQHKDTIDAYLGRQSA